MNNFVNYSIKFSQVPCASSYGKNRKDTKYSCLKSISRGMGKFFIMKLAGRFMISWVWIKIIEKGETLHQWIM